MPSRSPGGRPKSARCRNARSIPEWIDLAMFEFINAGEDHVKSFVDLQREQSFDVWLNTEENFAASREKLRNRFKYLRRLRSQNHANFKQAYEESIMNPPRAAAAPVAVTPPRAAAAPTAAAPAAAAPSAAAPTAAAAGGGTTTNADRARSHTVSSPPPPPPESMASASMKNAWNQLDFDRPENNPDLWWPVRNRNFTHDGMTIDKMEVVLLIVDMRDAINTDMHIASDGNILLTKPRTSAFVRTNSDDIYTAANSDPVIEQAHNEAVLRMRARGTSTRTQKFYLPEGVTIRTGPFSQHPTQIHKTFEETQMDFGEVDDAGLPILHEGHWLKFKFTINRPDENSTVRGDDINNLASRFGDIDLELESLPVRVAADPPAQSPPRSPTAAPMVIDRAVAPDPPSIPFIGDVIAPDVPLSNASAPAVASALQRAAASAPAAAPAAAPAPAPPAAPAPAPVPAVKHTLGGEDHDGGEPSSPKKPRQD